MHSCPMIQPLFLSLLLACTAFAAVAHADDTGRDLKTNWFSSEAPMTLEEVQESFPSVPHETVARFYEESPEHASAKLADYLDWKNAHTITRQETDAGRWNMAVQQALKYVAQQTPPEEELLFSTGLLDNEGHPVLLFFPCLLDVSLDGAIALYTDIFATYIDSYFIDDPSKKFTLLLDIRPGRGWPDPSQKQLLNAIETIANSIEQLEPGRISQLLMYPVPSYGTALWNLVKPFVDKHFHDELVFVHGDAVKLHAKVPAKELVQYIDGEVIQKAEEKRQSLFRPTDPKDALELQELMQTLKDLSAYGAVLDDKN